jgi:preprotein translocase subunit SecY
MLKALKNKKDFRKKLLITLGILAVIQIASGIPTPGVNTAYFRLLLKSNGTLGMLNKEFVNCILNDVSDANDVNNAQENDA